MASIGSVGLTRGVLTTVTRAMTVTLEGEQDEPASWTGSCPMATTLAYTCSMAGQALVLAVEVRMRNLCRHSPRATTTVLLSARQAALQTYILISVIQSSSTCQTHLQYLRLRLSQP